MADVKLPMPLSIRMHFQVIYSARYSIIDAWTEKTITEYWA